MFYTDSYHNSLFLPTARKRFAHHFASGGRYHYYHSAARSKDGNRTSGTRRLYLVAGLLEMGKWRTCVGRRPLGRSSPPFALGARSLGTRRQHPLAFHRGALGDRITGTLPARRPLHSGDARAGRSDGRFHAKVSGGSDSAPDFIYRRRLPATA